MRILQDAQILNPMYLLVTVFCIILQVLIMFSHFILYIPFVIMAYCQDTIIIFCMTIKMDDPVVSNGQLQQ